MKDNKKDYIVAGLMIVLLVMMGLNQFMLASIKSSQNIIMSQSQKLAKQSVQQNPQSVQQNAPLGQGVVEFSDAGYQKLLEYDKSTLTDNQLKSFVGLDVELPCCGFQKLQASGNCQCGHHVAMSGLAKHMIQENYTAEQVQTELNKWKKFFFPDSTASSGNAGGC